MAEGTIDLKVNNTQALGALRAVESQVTKLNTVFNSFKTVLGGLALGTVIQNSLQLATSIQNVATATGISTQTISNFTSAIVANGGSAQEAAGKIIEFTAKLDEARNGSIQLQAALVDAGISLNDLRKLSEQDLFTKTIQGLAKIEDSSRRNRLAVQLLGEEFKKIDVRTVAAAMGAVGGGANAGAIQAAADAQRNLSTQLNNLTNALINILEPFNKLISKIEISTQAFETFIKAIAAIAVAVGAFFILSKIETVIAGVLSGTSSLVGIFGKLKNIIISFFTSLKDSFLILVEGFKRGYTLGTRFISIITGLAGIILRLGGLTAIIYGIAQAVDFLLQLFFKFSVIDWISDKIKNLYNSAKEFFNLKPNMPDQTDAETNRLKRLNDEAEKRKQKQKEITEAILKQRRAVEDVINSFKKQNSEVSEQLALQRRLVGKSEEETEAINAQFELFKRYRDAQENLQQKLRDLSPDERKLGMAQIILQAQKELTKQYETEAKEVDDMIMRLQAARAIEADRARLLENMSKSYDAQAQRAQALGDILRGARTQLEESLFERAQMGRGPLDQQFEQIRENARKAALEAGRAFAAAFEDTGDGLTPERMKELQDGLDAIANAYKNIADAQLENLRISNTWESGWTKAFNEYYDNATSAANRARETFSSVTQAMESAIDRFVQTGKFSFKDFARSVIADLLKIELKAAAMNFLGGMKGTFLGSLFSSFAGFFAQGGYIPPGKTGIVGEAGPELISGPANVTPMGQVQAQPTIVNNYNISAIDSRSVAQFFAEHRRTMLGATEQARKEMPIRQRF